MTATARKVSCTDIDGVLHCVRVRAESLYETVALAVSEFRRDPMVAQLGPTTEFVVLIKKTPIEHRIRLRKVEHWAKATNRDGPAGVMKRQKIRALLG